MARASPSPMRTDRLTLYEKLVATIPGVPRKGDTVPYTSLNGRMFSYLTKEGRVALRLPTEAREAFRDKYGAKLVEQYGIVQKEFVEVPDALLEKTAELKRYFAQSHAFVASQPPKPTTRRKAPHKAPTKAPAAKKRR